MLGLDGQHVRRARRGEELPGPRTVRLPEGARAWNFRPGVRTAGRSGDLALRYSPADPCWRRLPYRTADPKLPRAERIKWTLVQEVRWSAEVRAGAVECF
ncbi:hypothetical protein NDU88_005773 [Pleurodeles waltl]|uniref:Uncharacterized protein n=1 Tax=Pleurodeles waltl TaxID=8319 RepID=A0AAV7TV71_PLEWA|nr:hypothetical protein NDU88_005773 [Pleurodeles waltl]